MLDPSRIPEVMGTNVLRPDGHTGGKPKPLCSLWSVTHKFQTGPASTRAWFGSLQVEWDDPMLQSDRILM